MLVHLLFENVFVCILRQLLTFLSTNLCGIICDTPPDPLELIGDAIELLLDEDFSVFVLQLIWVGGKINNNETMYLSLVFVYDKCDLCLCVFTNRI